MKYIVKNHSDRILLARLCILVSDRINEKCNLTAQIESVQEKSI